MFVPLATEKPLLKAPSDQTGVGKHVCPMYYVLITYLYISVEKQNTKYLIFHRTTLITCSCKD